MIKKVIFIFVFLSTIPWNLFSETAKCNFSDRIINCLINNIDEIEERIYYYDIGHEYGYFSRIENEFFEYLRELTLTNLEYNEAIFFEKYNNLITHIPVELNAIFSEYPKLENNGYEYYINFIIFLHIIIFENIDNGNLLKSELPIIDFEKINMENIKNIKSMFYKQDIDIIYDNERRIIERLKVSIE